MPANGKPPVVFVHGLWLHGESWNPWIAYFKQHGYDARAGLSGEQPGDGEADTLTAAGDQDVGHGSPTTTVPPVRVPGADESV